MKCHKNLRRSKKNISIFRGKVNYTRAAANTRNAQKYITEKLTQFTPDEYVHFLFSSDVLKYMPGEKFLIP